MIKIRINRGAALLLILLFSFAAVFMQPEIWGHNLMTTAHIESITFQNADLRDYVSPYASGIQPLADLNYVSGSYQWGGHNTMLFAVDGYIGFCLNPRMLEPGEGTYPEAYVTSFPASVNMRLAKVLYYGYGGPADMTQELYDSWEAKTAITHVAAAAAYGDPYPYYGLTEEAIRQVQDYLERIDARPDLDGNRNTVNILQPDQGMQSIGWLVSEQPPGGRLEIRKLSADPGISDDNSCYSLENGEFTVYRAGTEEILGTILTDADGYGRLENLEEGEYDIVETRAPAGYLLDTEVHRVTVNAGTTVLCECRNEPGYDPVDLLLLKRDAETGKSQGAALLEDAEYTVKYYDTYSVSDPAGAGKAPKYIWVFRTDSAGCIRLDEEHRLRGDSLIVNEEGRNVIPVGTVTIQETRAPAGYLLDETVYVSQIHVPSGAKTVMDNLPDGETAAAEEMIIRGDLEFMKTDADDLSGMEGIPFSITSETTGESHTVISGKDGKVSTSSEWNPHTQNTNRGLESGDGIWFGEGRPDDGRGALIYDTYLVEEQPCEANRGKDLLVFTVTISEDHNTVSLGELSNFTIRMETQAADQESGTKTAAAGKDACIVDKVTYHNLTVGREYQLKGILMIRESGTALTADGIPVTAETSFTPSEASGSVEVQFHFDGSQLAGKTLVVFENLYWKEICVASHADLEDENQTVFIGTMPLHPESVQTGDSAWRGEAVLVTAAVVTVGLVLWKRRRLKP